MKYRMILLPFSVLYGVITYIRNKFFDWGFLSADEYYLPVISIGNLSAGGTGKTPMVEYIIKLLKNDYTVATLSRGYKRTTSGFILADDKSTASQIGDEPLQFKKKFSGIIVCVDEKRTRGIEELIRRFGNLDVIILDDAFQHRRVKPGLSILVTDYHNLYLRDTMLPSGTLREYRSGARRADIIVVTKTPRIFSPIERRSLIEQIEPLAFQKVYFSFIDHGQFTPIPGLDFAPSNQRYQMILLVAGIVNTYPLEDFLRRRCDQLEILNFGDHHQYTGEDVGKIRTVFTGLHSKNKMIVTTEKDVMRFLQPEILPQVKGLPMCYIPADIMFHKDDEEKFNRQIREYVRKAKRDRQVY
jgi:tetraacyldisaccharide 4'-kinase